MTTFNPIFQLGDHDAARFVANQPVRPMLARVADSMYWLSRYVERAEHTARIITETSQLLTDVGDLSSEFRHDLWNGVLRILNLDQLPVAEALLSGTDEEVAQNVCVFMTFDPANPNSLMTCVTNARENARGIRENISGEIWEGLNTLYWFLQGDEARARFEESPQDVYRQVINNSMIFQGLTDQTLAHAQGWLFMQLAKQFERVDMTCRILEIKFDILQHAEALLEPAERNVHWMSVLRTCASLEAYRRIHVGDLDPMRVAAFLVLERHFPRSIRAGVHHAHDAINRIRATINPHSADGAQRILGRLNTQLEYAEPTEIINEGFAPYLRKVQIGMTQAADEVRKAYFLH